MDCPDNTDLTEGNEGNEGKDENEVRGGKFAQPEETTDCADNMDLTKGNEGSEGKDENEVRGGNLHSLGKLLWIVDTNAEGLWEMGPCQPVIA